MGYLRLSNKMKTKEFITPSFIVVIFIFLFCICTAHINKMWCGGDGLTPFCYDVKQYYSYLPQFLIEHDLDFKNRGDYWLDSLPNGNVFIKYSSGVAILEMPFFLLAWVISLLFKLPIDGGYSPVFFQCIHYGVFLYFLLGLNCLRKVLLHFKFNEVVISITLLSVFFGTNLFHYILGQGLMSHGFLFSLHCVFLYLIIKFYKNPGVINSILIGFTGGLIALIRPTEVVCFVVFGLWGVSSFVSFKHRILYLFNRYKSLAIIIICFVAVWIPQMLYWKHISGSYLLYSYTGEKLMFDSPKIFEIMFSPRNGLIPYCPIVLLFLLSLFIPKANRIGNIGIILFVGLNIYLASCWWCWWYGGSFGSRALVQIFPYLAITFAGLLQYVYFQSFKFKKAIKISVTSLTVIFVLLHLKFWIQSKHGFIHYDSMTAKAYWYVFPRCDLNKDEANEFYSLLKAPSYDPNERNTVK
jgi:hypothetical protein